MSRPPEGFVALGDDGARLWVRAEHATAARDLGLDRVEGWQARLAVRSGSGRGATATCDLSGGTVARLKQLRRGGLLAGLWRDRFPGSARPRANLTVTLEAVRRGVATPEPLALMLETRAGWVRAWLALEEIVGAQDLVRRLAAAAPPGREELAPLLGCVRGMHDAGLEHRDLNLGNLLLGPGGRVAVIDLDRARVHPGPLAFGDRQRALRRLERSYAKLLHLGRIRDVPGMPDLLYELYARDDATLADRLARGRPASRRQIRLHRLGWRR